MATVLGMYLSLRRRSGSGDPVCADIDGHPAHGRSRTGQSGCVPVEQGNDQPFDAQERRKLCAVFDELGAAAPTLLDGWTTYDLAAHIVVRERDPVAGVCIMLPGPFARLAERRRVRLQERRDFASLVARIRSGPPPGFFRIGWVRSFPNLNEFFVHQEDVRRANGMEPRTLAPELEAALWRNV